jgi:hypothetical protein
MIVTIGTEAIRASNRLMPGIQPFAARPSSLLARRLCMSALTARTNASYWVVSMAK